MAKTSVAAAPEMPALDDNFRRTVALIARTKRADPDADVEPLVLKARAERFRANLLKQVGGLEIDGLTVEQRLALVNALSACSQRIAQGAAFDLALGGSR